MCRHGVSFFLFKGRRHKRAPSHHTHAIVRVSQFWWHLPSVVSLSMSGQTVTGILEWSCPQKMMFKLSYDVGTVLVLQHWTSKVTHPWRFVAFLLLVSRGRGTLTYMSCYPRGLFGKESRVKAAVLLPLRLTMYVRKWRWGETTIFLDTTCSTIVLLTKNVVPRLFMLCK